MSGWWQWPLGIAIGLLVIVAAKRIERRHPWFGVWFDAAFAAFCTVLAAINLAQHEPWWFAFLACAAVSSAFRAWSKRGDLTRKATS